jgi:O-6-methylguanine DNA methyltransferase
MNGVWFTAAVNQSGQLVACAFSDRNWHDSEEAVKETVAVDFRAENNSIINRRLQQIFSLFLGKGKTNLNDLDLSRVSDFRRRVYFQLHRIPRGKVTTYGAIAKRLGSKTYSRAVGTAAATNPLPLVIPCHRVVPSTLIISNYGMPGRKSSEGAYMKRTLLTREGVKFIDDRVSEECLWFPD